ncbi:LuxR family transcriptional regulator [Streptomyces sp. HPF1205]|uniref:helix-turn-helix transcriptional regulator n=1 Tax=Streptomyces sp. HPF1205 TaxID=2873262 RepID=UPI0021F23F46|nr:LuxR family transcriptional regulator [Streptomyces sp. HPF1205]
MLMLYGRDREAAAIDALLDDARAGRSGVLVLRGDAGIGKSALLEYAVARAQGGGQARREAGAGAEGDGTGDSGEAVAPMTLVRGAGIEFEAELPYAGLQLLLRRAMGSLDALPEPQRRALAAAFGLASGGAGEPMFVGLAVLSLLSDHAGEGPLLCVVDDAQWLDRASVDALVFAARRLDAEGVAMVFAVRDGEGAFPAAGLPELGLGPLDAGAAEALLAAGGEPLPDPVHRRVLAEAQGNPLALLELPTALRGASASASAGAGMGTGAESVPAGPGGLPLTSRLRMAFHGRVSHLPPGTQMLLLVAAADHSGDPELLLRAATALGLGLSDLPPAQEAGLVFVDQEDRLRFRHPLMRAAIYQRAPLPDRLAAHRALADAADPVADPDHRAWHLAAAATGPDEAVAAVLQDTADRARERSGHAAAMAAYERAARLSTDPAARVERLVLAAESASEAGELARARSFAEQAARALEGTGDAGPGGSPGERPGSAVLRARTLHVRGLADFWQGAFPAAHRVLLEGAGLVAGADPQRAARMLVQATHTAWYLGGDEVAQTLDRLRALRLPEDAPIRPVAEFLTGALGSGAAGHAPPAVDAAAAGARAARGGRIDPRDLVMLCGVGLALGQDAQSYELTTALIAESRESGGLGRLTTLMFFHAEAEIFQSRYEDAYATAAEGLRISRDAGQAQWVSQLGSALAHVAAIRGDEEECRGHVDMALSAGASGAMAPGAPWAYWSQGLLELGLGRAQAALDRLSLLTGESVRHHISATRSVPDLVEAAVRLGVPERADEPLARFEAWAARSGQRWARALVARCRALRAPEAEAEAYFTEALAAHDPHLRAMETARTALLYGEWLRRVRRKSEAQGRLREALDAFERLGARPWAARALGELGAAGASVTAPQGTRSPAEEAGLTPQESQIVRLAARGMSNRDIAAQLFLSPRTVGYHLYKAYPKLGVVSRGELAAIFG